MAWIFASLAISAISICLRALRLKTVLGSDAGYKDVWASTALGYLTSLVIPMGGGEAAKALAVARASKLPVARTVSAVGLDRLFDLGTLAVLAAATLATRAAPVLRSGTLVLVCAAFALGLASASLSLLGKNVIGRGLVSLPLPTPWKARLMAAYGHWHDQAARLKRPSIWVELGALQATVFSVDVLAAWCGLHALPTLARLGLGAALQLNLFVMLAFAIPVLPGSLGTLQAAYVLALTPHGAPSAAAIALGVIGQAGHTALVGLMGLLALLRLRTPPTRRTEQGGSES